MCSTWIRKSSAAISLAAVIGNTPLSAAESILRVTCEGTHQLSGVKQQLECVEADSFVDSDGVLLTPSSTARASLHEMSLIAEVAGAAIRDVRYEGRAASALIIEALTLSGSWTGKLPVTFSLRANYRFDGFGEARLIAALRSSAPRTPSTQNHAGVQLRNTGLSGTRLAISVNKGHVEIPQSGYYPAEATIDISVTELLEALPTTVRLRSDLVAYSLPNLGSLEPAISSFLVSNAHLSLSAPCQVEISARRNAGALNVEVLPDNYEQTSEWSC